MLYEKRRKLRLHTECSMCHYIMCTNISNIALCFVKYLQNVESCVISIARNNKSSPDSLLQIIDTKLNDKIQLMSYRWSSPPVSPNYFRSPRRVTPGINDRMNGDECGYSAHFMKLLYIFYESMNTVITRAILLTSVKMS